MYKFKELRDWTFRMKPSKQRVCNDKIYWISEYKIGFELVEMRSHREILVIDGNHDNQYLISFAIYEDIIVCKNLDDFGLPLNDDRQLEIPVKKQFYQYANKIKIMIGDKHAAENVCNALCILDEVYNKQREFLSEWDVNESIFILIPGYKSYTIRRRLNGVPVKIRETEDGLYFLDPTTGDRLDKIKYGYDVYESTIRDHHKTKIVVIEGYGDALKFMEITSAFYNRISHAQNLKKKHRY